VWLEAARDRTDLGLTRPVAAGLRPLAIVRANRHEFATAGVTSYVLGLLRTSRQVVLPLWATHVGLSVTQISLIIGISSILDVSLFYPAGSVSDRYGRRAVAIPCVGFLAIGHLLLPLAHTSATLLMVALVLAFGNGLGSGIVMTLGADRAPEEGRPAFLAMWRLVSDAGASSGPVLDGALIAALSLAAAAPVVGLAGLVATAFTWRYLQETHTEVAEERTISVIDPPGGAP
jgi:MFS family permease